MSVTLKKLIVAAAVVICAVAASGAAPSAQLIPLKVAYDGYSLTTAPMNYAVQK